MDSLVKYKVITDKERQVIEKDLKDPKDIDRVPYRIAILWGLQNIILQKTFHVNPRKTGISLSYKGHPKKQIQDSINRSLHILLEKIKNADLLTNRVYTYTLQGVDTGRYIAEVEMTGSLVEMSARLERLSPEKLLSFAKELHQNDIVGDSAFILLKNDIENGKIESSFQLNDYCKLNRVFDLKDYPDDPDVWLEQIHNDIASMLPGLDFTNFSYKAIPDTSFSMSAVRFKVNLTCNGYNYSYMSFPIISLKSRNRKITPKDIFTEDFHRIFNKVLTDQHSPLRLHTVMFVPGTTDDEHFNHFSLIALNDSQARFFWKESSFMFVSMDGYDSTMTSTKIDNTIAGWEKIGLFSHLSSSEISKGIDDAKSDYQFSTDGLLFHFSGVVYNLHDALTGSNRPYDTILLKFAKITRGTFNPTKISQSKANGGLKLQYLSKGKIHSYTFPTTYGWLDPKFSAFINTLSRENYLPGNFYRLYDDEIIYLTKQQHDNAIKYKLLDFEPTASKHKLGNKTRWNLSKPKVGIH